MNASDPQTREKRVGVGYGLAAYVWWGVVVAFFKWVQHVPPLELLAHRISWSLLLLLILMTYRGRIREALVALREPRIMRILGLTTILVASNWFTFLFAVINDNVVQASLGYFINPLVNVVLGFVFLRERLRPAQWVAVGLALLGVAFMTVHLGTLPVVAIVLAVTFGLYGLLRKTVAVDSMVGLTVETTLLFPLSVGYLIWLAVQGDATFFNVSRSTDVLLVSSGAVTALPLLWFAHAARRLRLSTVGVLQYIAPSLQLLMGVAVYGESFSRGHAVSFGCIWAGLILYSWDSLRRAR